MLRLIVEALRAGLRRSAPTGAPPGLRGRVEIDFQRCTLTGACAEACPTPALRLQHDPERRHATLSLDLGHCVFCGLCEEACPEGAVRLSSVWDLAVRRREDLVTTAVFTGETGPDATPARPPAPDPPAAAAAGAALRRRVLDLLGRSLHVRHLDAGSCGGCEREVRSSLGPVHDLTRYGIDFVVSPRHADLLLVTGPVTRSLAALVTEAHAAIPDPKLVVALGACAIGGGIHAGGYGQTGGLEGKLPVDVWVPGCPPRPQAILHGLLVALERAKPRLAAPAWRGAYPA